VVRNSIYCHISLRKKMGQHFFFQEICEMSNCYNFLGQRSRKKPFNFPSMGPPWFPLQSSPWVFVEELRYPPHRFPSELMPKTLRIDGGDFWGCGVTLFVRWWATQRFVYVHPDFWGKIFPFLTSIFFQGVGSTTN